MSKYGTFLNILDKIRQEAPEKFKKYSTSETDPEKINQSRARAFIHLYLMVSFGLLDFSERENNVTDGSFDGGIDGYYIDQDSKTIYFIQSKFRTSETNFQSKEIDILEILSMDISRILEGETKDENGNEYNGKIKQMTKTMSSIKDIGRYRYEIIILANITKISQSNMRKLTDGYPVKIFDFNKTYKYLVYPVVSGTFFNASDLHISLDLSNKNAGSKISYTVETQHSKCEITVLFVPTIEVAKLMQKYKNSILKYNPRSYLEISGQKVNSSIRESIMNKTTNEFALYNNGITMLSDESYLNEKFGQKNKAQLTVTNPQIINGGQTSFTLSRILDEVQKVNEEVFYNKEVLLKIITFTNDENTVISEEKKLELIEAISQATNQQTTVTNADKVANNKINIEIQDKLFNKYGIFYERKLGEFADGIARGYISEREVLERNLFYKIMFATQGKINDAKQKRLFQKYTFENHEITEENLNKFYFGYLVFLNLTKYSKVINLRNSNLFGRIYASVLHGYNTHGKITPDHVERTIYDIDSKWKDFEGFASKKPSNSRFGTTYFDKNISNTVFLLNFAKYYNTENFRDDILEYYNPK